MKKGNYTVKLAFVVLLTTIHSCAAGTLIPLQGQEGRNPGASEVAESHIVKQQMSKV